MTTTDDDLLLEEPASEPETEPATLVTDDDLDPFAELEAQADRKRTRPIWKQIRHFFVVTHRWISLVLTVWVVIVSITGAWLVFHQAFDRQLHKDRFATTQGDLGAQAAIDAVTAELPDNAAVDYLNTPANGGGVYRVYSTETIDEEAEEYKYVQWFVDPGSAHVNGSEEDGVGFTHWMYRGHEYLWQDNGVFGVFDPQSGWCRTNADGAEPGGVKGIACDVIPDGMDLIGWFAIALIYIAATGFYLWYWPNVRRWATALLIKRGKGRFQFHLSLHKVIGLVVFVPLIIISFTGAAFAFPNMKSWYENTTPAGRDHTLWEPPEDLASGAADGREPMDATEFLTTVHDEFPDRRITAIAAFPTEETATWQAWTDYGYTVWTREGSGGNTLVALDQYTGEVLYDGTPEDGNVAEQLWTDWSFPLHAGDFGGTPTRWLWFVVGGIAPVALTVTGVVMWWVRRKRVNAIAAKKASAET